MQIDPYLGSVWEIKTIKKNLKKQVFSSLDHWYSPWCCAWLPLKFFQTKKLMVEYLPMFRKQFSLASVFLPGLGV